MSECPLFGGLSRHLNFLSSAGSLWLDNPNTTMSRKQSPREFKVSKNGIAKSITPQPLILFVLVCFHTKMPNRLSTLVVLDPNVKDLYCRHWWEPEQYTAGMTRLEEVVSWFSLFYVVALNLTPVSLMSTMSLQKCRQSHQDMKPTPAKACTVYSMS